MDRISLFVEEIINFLSEDTDRQRPESHRALLSLEVIFLELGQKSPLSLRMPQGAKKAGKDVGWTTIPMRRTRTSSSTKATQFSRFPHFLLFSSSDFPSHWKVLNGPVQALTRLTLGKNPNTGKSNICLNNSKKDSI